MEKGAGAVHSAQGFGLVIRSLIEQMGKFLGDHIAVCGFFFVFWLMSGC